MNYLSGQYLLEPAGPGFRYVWPAVVFFLLMPMLGTSFAYFVGETNNKRAPISRMARRVQTIGWTLSVVGLVLIGFRMGDARIPLLESRIVLYLVALGLVALVAYVLWFLRFVLPEREEAYQQLQLRRQYQPRARRR